MLLSDPFASTYTAQESKEILPLLSLALLVLVDAVGEWILAYRQGVCRCQTMRLENATCQMRHLKVLTLGRLRLHLSVMPSVR